MLILPRKPAFRVSVSVVLALAASVWLALDYDPAIRDKAIDMLKSVTFAFSACISASLLVFSNYVKGAREAYFKRVATIRDTLEKLVDNYKGSSSPEIRELINTFALPMLRMNRDEWSDIYIVGAKYDALDIAGHKAHMVDPLLVPRYLMRIEDDMNELGQLFLRRVFSQLHASNVEGTFLIVALAFVLMSLSLVVPHAAAWDLAIVSAVIVLVISTVFELLLIVSYLSQEAREEGTSEIPKASGSKA